MKKETRVTHQPKINLPEGNESLVEPVYRTVKFTYPTIDGSPLSGPATGTITARLNSGFVTAFATVPGHGYSTNDEPRATALRRSGDNLHLHRNSL